MLNWAARYYPILRILRQHNLHSSGSILEIGSGSVGLGAFRKVPFTGCDLSFSVLPQWPMTPVIASAMDLPFSDKSYDAVIASDVLEHIPPEARKAAIHEALRVAQRLVIFGFPCGLVAHDADRMLVEVYQEKGINVPAWLQEHMLASFPEESLFDDIQGWQLSCIGNENIKFHMWMMRQELHGTFVRASTLLMRFAPRLLEKFLYKADQGSSHYRKIFVLQRLA